jgi:outer membrane protein OmpA-like peptidoglycan-associated protein
MDSAHWHTGGDKFECRLTQDVPFFGHARFVRRAGEPLRFELASTTNPLQTGNARLTSDAPSWAQHKEALDLGVVSVDGSAKPVKLGRQQATLLLSELGKGMAPRFDHMAWFHNGQSLAVKLSSAYFQDAYSKYRHCESHLLPMGFAQLERSRVHFDTNISKLGKSARQLLDNIAAYTLADESVSKIYVDGHTDNVWERDYNVILSRKRAQSVTNYLVRAGIDKKRIVTRYHGERYPVKPNTTATGRAKNRRVTVRLER